MQRTEFDPTQQTIEASSGVHERVPKEFVAIGIAAAISPVIGGNALALPDKTHPDEPVAQSSQNNENEPGANVSAEQGYDKYGFKIYPADSERSEQIKRIRKKRCMPGTVQWLVPGERSTIKLNYGKKIGTITMREVSDNSKPYLTAKLRKGLTPEIVYVEVVAGDKEMRGFPKFKKINPKSSSTSKGLITWVYKPKTPGIDGYSVGISKNKTNRK